MSATAGGDDAPLTDRDYEVLARFRAALRVFLHFSEDAAAAEHLTPAQHQLLLAVRGHAGATAPSVSDLADALQRRRHSVGELVDRAAAAGLVTSAPDPADGRRRLVTLTADGSARLARLTALHRAELRRFRAEMADLVDLLG